MSLQLVTGPSGSGKSYYLYNTIIKESMENPEERFFVIVPEQFTMQTQKELVRLHPGHSLMNVDILSFNRLAYRVFAETGESRAPILEDTGKILVLQKVLSENRESLKVLGKMFGSTGTAAHINSLLSEFTQYRTDPKEIVKEKGDMPELLKRKLDDIVLISEKFSEFMAGKYLTAEEVPVVLGRVIEGFEELKGATVAFDGFTGFVPTQLEVIGKLLKMCRKVYVTAVSDKKTEFWKKSTGADLFNMTYRMVSGLTKAASEAGVPVEKDIRTEHSEHSRFGGSRALSFLERRLFRYEYDVFEGEQDSVFLGRAGSVSEEAESAAEMICDLVRTKGYRYRDFAFVSGDLERYGEETAGVFEENGIPCFLDKKQSIMSNTAVEFLRSAIEMAVDNYTYKSVFRFLKSGLTDFDTEEICLLENYVLARAVKGFNGYKKEWTKLPKTFNGTDLEKVNVIRERFVTMTEEFTESFRVRNGTVRERTTALYGFLKKCGIYGKCTELEKRFADNGEAARSLEYAQIYKLIIGFLEKYVEIMGNEHVSAELYRQMTEAGLSDIKLGIIPPNQDQVVIGDIERTRLKDIKIMFFAGLNEGIVPKPVEKAGILSESDRRRLSRMNVELAPDAREEMYRQRLYLYLALTKPSERLYLSYSTGSTGGEAMLPSYLVNVIKEMFCNIRIFDLSGRSMEKKLETKRGRAELLLDCFENIGESGPGDGIKELISFYRQKKDTDLIIENLISAAKAHKPETNISKEAAEMLYGENTGYSASRAELFCECQFSHFLKYGLKLKEREIFEFSAMDIGNILHDAIRAFGEYLKTADISSLNDDEIRKAADEAFAEAYGKESGNAGSSSSRVFDEARLKVINRMNAWAMAEHLKAGDFIPFSFEEDFNFEGIKGKIDRIDYCVSDGNLYIRVIDYKSSDRSVELDHVLYGTQIQLPLYMVAAKRKAGHRVGKKAETAGIYYYSMTDMMTEKSDMNEEVTREDLMKHTALTGYSSDDPGILYLLDNELNGPKKKSAFIAAAFLKDRDAEGNLVPTQKSKVLSGEDFAVLEGFIKYILCRIREDIENGSALIDPKIIGKNDSCSFCRSGSVCGFDKMIPGYKKLMAPSEKDERVLIKKMQDKMNGGDENGD